MAIRAYNMGHITPKLQGGGLYGDLFSVSYQSVTSDAVSPPIAAPAISNVKIHNSNFMLGLAIPVGGCGGGISMLLSFPERFCGAYFNVKDGIRLFCKIRYSVNFVHLIPGSRALCLSVHDICSLR